MVNTGGVGSRATVSVRVLTHGGEHGWWPGGWGADPGLVNRAPSRGLEFNRVHPPRVLKVGDEVEVHGPWATALPPPPEPW